MKKVIIEIDNLLEIPLAYKNAIIKYNGGDDDLGDRDVWNAKIELKQINFEHNFRRTTYECVFEITEGDFIEKYKPQEKE